MMPKEASTIEEKQTQTKRLLMEVERFLFFLTPTITSMLRDTPMLPMSRRKALKT